MIWIKRRTTTMIMTMITKRTISNKQLLLLLLYYFYYAIFVNSGCISKNGRESSCTRNAGVIFSSRSRSTTARKRIRRRNYDILYVDLQKTTNPLTTRKNIVSSNSSKRRNYRRSRSRRRSFPVTTTADTDTDTETRAIRSSSTHTSSTTRSKVTAGGSASS